MAAIGKIRLDFETLQSAYRPHNNLPPPVKQYLDGLNKNIPDGQPKHTSCCLQVSHALNATSDKLYSNSHRRPNPKIGSDYYIQAVDELENYLIGRYGTTEDVKKGPAGKPRNEAEIKEYLRGKRGLLIFGIKHTELWNGNTILQRGGASGMNEPNLFGQQKILFWEITTAADPNPIPSWVQGWWSVWDGNQYYYYFSNQHGVTYVKTRPTSLALAPTRSTLNGGTVTMTTHGLVIEWNPADGGATTETFTRAGWTSQVEMNGTSNRYSPLVAKKMKAAPRWVQGWWSVWDGKQYYYYFSDQHRVTYTKTKPVSPGAAPPKTPLNEGTVTLTDRGLVIDWNPADGGATQETFTRAGGTSEVEMNGASNRYSPLLAKKI